jgi:hypothetical protein
VRIKTDLNESCFTTVAIDTPGGKRNFRKMKIKAQQMTFRQDITNMRVSRYELLQGTFQNSILTK